MRPEEQQGGNLPQRSAHPAIAEAVVATSLTFKKTQDTCGRLDAVATPEICHRQGACRLRKSLAPAFDYALRVVATTGSACLRFGSISALRCTKTLVQSRASNLKESSSPLLHRASMPSSGSEDTEHEEKKQEVTKPAPLEQIELERALAHPNFTGDSSEAKPFYSARRAKLRTRRFLPQRDVAVKALFFHFHDFGDHVRRESVKRLALALTAEGIAWYGLDFQGHGLSYGPRGTVASYKELVVDMETFIGIVCQEHRRVPFFVYGDAMGGALALLLAHNLQSKASDRKSQRRKVELASPVSASAVRGEDQWRLVDGKNGEVELGKTTDAKRSASASDPDEKSRVTSPLRSSDYTGDILANVDTHWNVCDYFKGLVLVSPLNNTPSPVWAYCMLPFVCNFFCGHKVPGCMPIPRDPLMVVGADAVADRKDDPLSTFTQRQICLETLEELMDLSSAASSVVNKLTVPICLLHGALDSLSPPDSSQWVYKRCQTRTEYKELHIYGGVGHDVLGSEKAHDAIGDAVHFCLNLIAVV